VAKIKESKRMRNSGQDGSSFQEREVSLGMAPGNYIFCLSHIPYIYM